MTNILVISQERLAGAIAPSTGKIMKNVPECFKREWNLLQNGILNFAISSSQSPVIAFQSQNLHWQKSDFLQKASAVKGLIVFHLQMTFLLLAFKAGSHHLYKAYAMI